MSDWTCFAGFLAAAALLLAGLRQRTVRGNRVPGRGRRERDEK